MTAPIRWSTPDVLVIDVTEQDIREGVRGHARQCPIAHALRRAGSAQPMVHADRVAIGGDGLRSWDFWPTSPALSQFVADFDAAADVAPCTLTLTRHPPRR